jgi:hypothetical protein
MCFQCTILMCEMYNLWMNEFCMIFITKLWDVKFMMYYVQNLHFCEENNKIIYPQVWWLAKACYMTQEYCCKVRLGVKVGDYYMNANSQHVKKNGNLLWCMQEVPKLTK